MIPQNPKTPTYSLLLRRRNLNNILIAFYMIILIWNSNFGVFKLLISLSPSHPSPPEGDNKVQTFKFQKCSISRFSRLFSKEYM